MFFFLRRFSPQRSGRSLLGGGELQGPKAEDLVPIAAIVGKSIDTGKIPGAVVLVGDSTGVIYRKAFGYRAVTPERLPMTVDTIFDLSSLTKVIATATAVMQLAESGKLRLDAPVARYWPEFKAKGKGAITVRQLLTHFSGLRPDLDLKPAWSGYGKALRLIAKERPVCPPGTRFIYSDINFEILGELVRRISGKPLDVYCAEKIFAPLGMKDTGFTPPPELRRRIAPTEYLNGNGKRMLWGEVHDPSARRMGGVAGHAGLFSTCDDLSIFARMLLEGGEINGVRILKADTVKRMTSSSGPSLQKIHRGLGWDIDSPFSSVRGAFPFGSYGHTGFTGTSLWIDPFSKTYVIVLTSRLHPEGRGDAATLRTEISTLVASSLGYAAYGSKQGPGDSYPSPGKGTDAERPEETRKGKVWTGIDVLEAERFAPLTGLRVGLITNHSGLDSRGRRTIDLLYRAPGVRLKVLFAPEHGLSGTSEGVSSGGQTREPVTGLPVYSLYGKVVRPTETMLEGLDALVFDVQGVGVRFYTYITTMAYAMEAAAKKGIAFYVLDRPDPIAADIVQGFLPEDDRKSFTCYFPLPVRHGMTMGELAEMFNEENRIGAELHVVKMRGYERDDWYDDTGLPWVNPSPNLRSLTETVLYPGVALVEGTNVSVGRGTQTPFELLGAPWMRGKELASYLSSRGIRGVRFSPVDFTPSKGRFKDRLCRGVRISLIDRRALNPAVLGIEIIAALFRLYPKDFHLDKALDIVGAPWIIRAVRKGQEPASIEREWQSRLERFRRMREKYLLY